MKNLFLAYKVEWLKTKGLGLTYLAIGIGALLPIIIVISSFFSPDFSDPTDLKEPIFENGIEESLKSFVLFLFLLFIIVCANRITQTDHKNGGWLLMETQPVKKLNIYLGKYFTLLTYSLICIISYFIFVNIAILVLYYIKPSPTNLLEFDGIWILKTFIRIFISCLGICALQLLISVIIKGFIWPFLIGILGFIVNVFSLTQNKNFPYSPYNTFYLMTKNKNVRDLNHIISYSEYLSLFYALIFLLIGYLWYSNKGFLNAFIHKKKWIMSLLGILVIGGIYYFITQPKVLPSENITRIQGKFETDEKIDSVKIITKNLHTKIASVPVKNNEFLWETKENLPLDEYILIFGSKKYPLTFAKGDWFDLFFRFNGTTVVDFMKSNRKAEQEYAQHNDNFGRKFTYLDQTQDVSKAKEYYEVAEDDWKTQLEYLNNFATAENYGLSDDFKQYRKQLLAVQYLNKINDFKQLAAANHINIAPSKYFVDELQKIISKPTQLLLNNSDYLNFKLNEIGQKNNIKEDQDSLMFKILAQLPNEYEKDQLVAKKLLTTLKLKTDSASRNSLFRTEVVNIENKEVKNYVTKELFSLNVAQKGMPFPDLDFIDAAGKNVKLSSLKGKYVVIDLWATWCQPCLKIRPIYEARAKDYRYYDNIKFMSVSVDEDRKKWENFLKIKPSATAQWYLPNAQQMLNAFKIKGIPTFIVLDPQGKIYTMNAPRPDEDDFVELLNNIKQF